MQAIEAWSRRCVRWIKQQEHNEVYKSEWTTKDAEQIVSMLQRHSITANDTIEKALNVLNDKKSEDHRYKSTYQCLSNIFDAYKSQILRCADEAFTKIANRGDISIRVSFFSTITFTNIYDNPFYNDYCTTPMGKNERLMTQIGALLNKQIMLQMNDIQCPDSYCVSKMFDNLIDAATKYITVDKYSYNSQQKLNIINDIIIPECLVTSAELQQWQKDIIVSNDQLLDIDYERIVHNKLLKWLDTWSEFVCDNDKSTILSQITNELNEVEREFDTVQDTTLVQQMAKTYTKHEQIKHSQICLVKINNSIRLHLRTLKVHCKNNAPEMMQLLDKAQSQCSTDEYDYTEQDTREFKKELSYQMDKAIELDCFKYQFSVLRQLKADTLQRGVLATFRNKWRDTMLDTLNKSKSMNTIELQFSTQLKNELDASRFVDSNIIEIPRLWQKTFDLILKQADDCKDSLMKIVNTRKSIKVQTEQNFTLPHEWIAWLIQIDSYFEQHKPFQFLDMCTILEGYLTDSKVNTNNTIAVE